MSEMIDAEPAAEQPIIVTSGNGVAEITLNRPAAANSINAPLARAFREAISRLDADAAVKVLILKGAGRMFCAGGDLGTFAREGDGAAAYVKDLIADLHAALLQLTRFHAPVIAAVHGAVAGAGLGIALASDFIVAEENSRFVMAYTRAGLTPDGGTSWALPRAVGLRHALELTLLNRTLTAQEALAKGLINEVATQGALAGRVEAIADELASGPTVAFAAARRLLREAETATYADQLAREAVGIVESFGRPEGLEGVLAFSQRRQAVFRTP